MAKVFKKLDGSGLTNLPRGDKFPDNQGAKG
jgi:hypothetical protein